MSLAAALAERPSLVQAAQQRQAALVAAAKEARATEEKARGKGGFRVDNGKMVIWWLENHGIMVI
jgi:hypothetical protein